MKIKDTFSSGAVTLLNTSLLAPKPRKFPLETALITKFPLTLVNINVSHDDGEALHTHYLNIMIKIILKGKYLFTTRGLLPVLSIEAYCLVAFDCIVVPPI